MYYVVTKDGKPLYIGSDNQKAFATFNRGGIGASLETVQGEEALNELLAGYGEHVSACGVKGCCAPMCQDDLLDDEDLDEEYDDEEDDEEDDDEEFWDAFFEDDTEEVTLEDVKEMVNEVVDVTLDTLGVTREDVKDFVGRVKERGTEAAEDTKSLARKGVSVLGNVFTRIGERLSRTAE